MAAKLYDVTLKDLIESDTISWARRFSTQTVHKVTLLDADVSTLTAAADSRTSSSVITWSASGSNRSIRCSRAGWVRSPWLH
jgi:hypothetical protein